MCRNKDSSTIAKIVALEGGGYRIEGVDVKEDSELRNEFAHKQGLPLDTQDSNNDFETLERKQESLQFWLVMSIRLSLLLVTVNVSMLQQLYCSCNPSTP